MGDRWLVRWGSHTLHLVFRVADSPIFSGSLFVLPIKKSLLYRYEVLHAIILALLYKVENTYISDVKLTHIGRKLWIILGSCQGMKSF